MTGVCRGPTSRRSLLAALGTGALATSSGCLSRARSLTGWESSHPIRLRIKTLPADSDPYALALSRQIAAWFREAGIDAEVLPMAEQELLRQCLLQTSFDLFVMRLPARFRTADALWTLLHSRHADAPGWQNPFGYADLDVDAALDRQRWAEGAERRAALAEIQRTVARAQPFTLLTVPDDIRAARTDAHPDWGSADFQSPLGYLGATGAADESRLRIVGTDRRPTTNLNPLSVEFRRNGVLTGLLYDPLVRAVDGDARPWLAESIEFSDGERPSATVDLRPEVAWHDGEPLTADDVAFTYALLSDTTLDDDSATVRSPQYSGRSSLVEGVTVVDDRRVEISFVRSSRTVAERALTVPILPEHVWTDRTSDAEIGGIPLGRVTEALVASNIPPVGSGPFEFVENAPRDRLLLERVDDHFSTREDAGFPESIADPQFEELAVEVVGSDVTGVETVASGDADVTGTVVGASTVPRIGRASGTELLVEASDRPYVLGYNTRRVHLDNPRFRNTLARLVDGAFLGDDVLDGYARPAVGPLHGTEWYPEELEWDDGNPVVPFIGQSGELDVPAAQEAFREAGYQYDDAGKLVGRGA